MSISCPNVYYNYPTIWDKYRRADVEACDDLRFVKVPVSLKHRAYVCAALGFVLDEAKCCPEHCKSHCAKKCGLKCLNIETCHMKNSCCHKPKPYCKEKDVLWTKCGDTHVPCRLPKCHCCQYPKLLTFDDVPIPKCLTYFPGFKVELAATVWKYEGLNMENFLIYMANPLYYPNEPNSIVSRHLFLGSVRENEPATMSRHEPFGVTSCFITYIDTSPVDVFRTTKLVIKGYLKGRHVKYATHEMEITSKHPTLFKAKHGAFSKVDKLSFECGKVGWLNIDNLLLCL